MLPEVGGWHNACSKMDQSQRTRNLAVTCHEEAGQKSTFLCWLDGQPGPLRLPYVRDDRTEAFCLGLALLRVWHKVQKFQNDHTDGFGSPWRFLIINGPEMPIRSFPTDGINAKFMPNLTKVHKIRIFKSGFLRDYCFRTKLFVH